jgi:hypothetical protein
VGIKEGASVEVIEPEPVKSEAKVSPPAVTQTPPPAEALDRFARVAFIHLLWGHLSLTEITSARGPGFYRLSLRGDNDEILCEAEGTLDDVALDLAETLSRRFNPEPGAL